MRIRVRSAITVATVADHIYGLVFVAGRFNRLFLFFSPPAFALCCESVSCSEMGGS